MVLHCPRCGRRIPDDAMFCLYCGKSVRLERTGLPLAGGVLVIISSSISILAGVLFALIYLMSGTYMSSQYYSSYPTLSFFSFLGFISGLYGGIHAIKRESYSSAMGGTVMMILMSIIFSMIGSAAPYSSGFVTVIFSCPIIILSLLGGAFVASKKKEFLPLQRLPVAISSTPFQCSICGFQNPHDCNFCGRCGKPLRKDDTQIY